MKVICPFHNDTRPSMHIYREAGFCFVCKARAPLSVLKIDPTFIPEDPEPEDLEVRFAYIDSLPTKEIRGFQMPYDDDGYYIVWPDRSYYKKRRYSDDPRYIGPKGHKEPLYWARQSGCDSLYICEGQLNSASIAQVVPADVCSPGSATQMQAKSHLTEYGKYANIVIVADDDPAGRAAGITLKAALSRAPFVSLIFTDPNNDPNDILVRSGKEALAREIKRLLLKAL